jgi:hypothetical protein
MSVLSTKQLHAIHALVNYPTIREAALHAGIAERTLYRWAKEKTFRLALNEARRTFSDKMLTAMAQRKVDAMAGAAAT